MKKDILFASNNGGKFKEAAEVFRTAEGVRLVSPHSISGKGAVPEPEEHGSTYTENAAIKAAAFYKWSGVPSLADDAGLEVAALCGKPGLYSARYAGPGANSEKNIDKLLAGLSELEDKAGGEIDRSARFVCYLALVGWEKETIFVEAEVRGEIARQRSGTGGFGYDSVFTVEGYGKSLALLKDEGVHVKTHRVLALEKLLAGALGAVK